LLVRFGQPNDQSMSSPLQKCVAPHILLIKGPLSVFWDRFLGYLMIMFQLHVLLNC